LKGGVTWPNAAFPITWKWSGANGNNIYIGVDQSWYAGSSWTRPIFDAGGTPIAGNYNQFIRAMSTSYQTWDNIEMKGINWSTNAAYGSLTCGVWAGGQAITIDNWYVHGWSHAANTTSDGFVCILGDTNSPYMVDSVVQHSIFDGTDSTNGGDSGSFTHAWPSAKWNVVHNATNAILPTGHGEVAYNHIYNIHASFDSSVHENAIETLIADGTFYIHDNVIHDTYGECMMIGNPGETDYVWNNVIYQGATGACNPPHFPQNGKAGIAMYFWNNTINARGGSGNCFIQVSPPSPGWSIVEIQNNHCITSATLTNTNPSAGTVTMSNNVVMAPTVAASQGYSQSSGFAYAPSSATDVTVGAGTNLGALAIGIVATLTNDTTYSCTVTTGNQVACPARTVNARSGVWDVGAYQFSGITAQAPAPPTGLTATVN
jgi:hypothetical protein